MMDWVHIPGIGRVAVPTAAARVIDEVAAERLRQIELGHRAEDDDRFVRGELARAAAARVLWAADALARLAGEELADGFLAELAGTAQPLALRQPAPAPARRLLVEAAALLLAELERLDRAAGGGP